MNNSKHVIKACPFCGGPPIRLLQDRGSTDFVGIMCEDCEATIGTSNIFGYRTKERIEEAIDKWNKRVV